MLQPKSCWSDASRFLADSICHCNHSRFHKTGAPTHPPIDYLPLSLDNSVNRTPGVDTCQPNSYISRIAVHHHSTSHIRSNHSRQRQRSAILSRHGVQNSLCIRMQPNRTNVCIRFSVPSVVTLSNGKVNNRRKRKFPFMETTIRCGSRSSGSYNLYAAESIYSIHEGAFKTGPLT